MAFGQPKQGMGSGLFGKESALNAEVYLNLTPLMDVMSNILFFLLATFGASVIAILPTTVPVRSDDSSVDSALDRVTVTLRADAEALTISCESGTLTDEQLATYRARLAKRGGQYDHEALTAALKRIKERFPGSKTLVLVPDDDLLYEVLVKLMDASRETRLPEGGRMELFPEVVMSGIAPALPGAPPAPTATTAPEAAAPVAPGPAPAPVAPAPGPAPAPVAPAPVPPGAP
ncbi:MAG: biopolymer transporter ExbD [Deltaproteobacteria bacterium]|nr:biopolymer transporter ExbD [Deltaproteobacteria bacterium]